MSISFIKIKNAIDAWDPIELLITHAPPDEYDGESKEIYNILQLTHNIDANELSQIISDIFSRRFGNDVFNKTLEECGTVAQEILL